MKNVDNYNKRINKNKEDKQKKKFCSGNIKPNRTNNILLRLK